MTTIWNKLYSNDNNKEEDEMLLQPFNYAASVYAEGRRTMKTFWGVFNNWLDVPEEKVQQVFDLLEISYLSFYILDDIEDNSLSRNGSPTPHTIFGVDRTLTAINYANVLAGEKILELKSPEFMNIYIKQGMEFFKGQGLEIYWRDNLICPTEEEYLKMIYYKANGPLVLGVQLMQLFSDNKSDFMKLIQIIGDFIQIHNDYMSLKSQKYMDLKCYAEDITEGKFSFPIIHAVRSHPEDDQIMNIMKMRTTDIEMKKYCISLMEKYGSFEYTRRFLEDLKRQGIEEMNKFGENPSLIQMFDNCLNNINDYIII